MQQAENIEGNAPGCYNDMDMLIVGMHGNGNVGMGGCTDEQYRQHFAMWAFLGSPLIIGSDIRKLDEYNTATLLNRGLISVNQDMANCPAFLIYKEAGRKYAFGRLLSGNRIALAFFNIDTKEEWAQTMSIAFDDLGIHSESGIGLKLTDVVTGEEKGIFYDGYSTKVPLDGCEILVGELVH